MQQEQIVADAEAWSKSWGRSLRSANKSGATQDKYLLTLRQFAAHLADSDGPDQLVDVKRQHVEGFIATTLESRSAATANTRYQSLLQFFKYLAEEEEIDSPMAGMKPPIVPEQPVPVVQLDDLTKLLKSVNGKSLADRRDNAMLRLFIDAGPRVAEVAGMTIHDVDSDTDVAQVLGKGRRLRTIPYGDKTAQAIERYLRMRDRHPLARTTDALWLGLKGPLTTSGIRQMMERRTEKAGLGKIHPHQLRHTFAHQWRLNGGDETDLMRIAGWKSRTMLNRYGASAADERARKSHRKLSLGDQL